MFWFNFISHTYCWKIWTPVRNNNIIIAVSFLDCAHKEMAPDWLLKLTQKGKKLWNPHTFGFEKAGKYMVLQDCYNTALFTIHTSLRLNSRTIFVFSVKFSFIYIFFFLFVSFPQWTLFLLPVVMFGSTDNHLDVRITFLSSYDSCISLW